MTTHHHGWSAERKGRLTAPTTRRREVQSRSQGPLTVVGVQGRGVGVEQVVLAPPPLLSVQRVSAPRGADSTHDGDVSDAFRRKVEKWLVTVGEHQRWTGGRDGNGTPVVRWQGRKVGVRRQLFLLENGLTSTMLSVRQVCGDTTCVRPAHAEACRAGGRFQSVWDRLAKRATPMDGGCLVVDADRADGQAPSVSWRGRRMRVSRAVWEEKNGTTPEGMVVAHCCRRSACVALDHLYLSTPEREIALTTERGLFAGEAHWNHKLTNDQVLMIRSIALRSSDLAILCGVAPSTIRSVRARRSWTHL
ncbi:HNH endonuclease [Streptomyces sp. NPDC058572]|uniref:HNH endonuclease n=1 Tax=Streptomyces sp. NPDC058572 TaxID=3346546 RepID=UPI00366A1CA3